MGALRWAPILCALLCSSCIRLNWERHILGEEVLAEQHASLEEGTSDLESCLARMGAPMLVWEEPNGSMALAWAWREDWSWGINMSVPLAEQFSASADYADADDELHGLVLVFDRERRLMSKSRGSLADLTQKLKRERPALVERKEAAQP